MAAQPQREDDDTSASPSNASGDPSAEAPPPQPGKDATPPAANDDAAESSARASAPAATPSALAATPAESAADPDPAAQRRFPRINLALTARLEFASAEAAIDSKTVDISEGGVFIKMTNPRPEGTSIRILLRVGDRSLTIDGVVVRSVRPGEGEPTGIGVLFTSIHDDDLEFVRSLVRRELSDG